MVSDLSPGEVFVTSLPRQPGQIGWNLYNGNEFVRFIPADTEGANVAAMTIVTPPTSDADVNDLLADLSKIGPPSWVSKVLTFGLPLVGTGLATVDPAHTLPTPTVKAIVIAVAFALGVVVHVAELIRSNGLTKAGLLRSVSESERWFKSEAPAIQDAWQRVEPIVDAIPGVPAALADVQAHLADLEKLYADLPAAQRDAAVSAVRDVLGIKA